MISFYPGPSRVHEEIPQYVKDAYNEGVMSINHRSDEFMKLSEEAIVLTKNKLHIPEDYTVFYTGSATECWEIIAQSLITDSSFHIYNGAFGKKWYEYTSRICAGAKKFPFDLDDVLAPDKINPGNEGGVICVTQNETSNGTQVSNSIILQLKQRFPGNLIAVDATSGMAGVFLDISAADIWFASVQKCFGLPAGLGLMICSPAAMQKVREIGERAHYNSLSFMEDMIQKWQTPFTPNVLNIYLLARVMKKAEPILMVHKETEERYRQWMEFFSTKKTLRHLVDNHAVRSLTVIPIQATESMVTDIKSRAKENGLLLGEGYGDLRSSTFRIANFPAIKKSEIKALRDFLSGYD